MKVKCNSREEFVSFMEVVWAAVPDSKFVWASSRNAHSYLTYFGPTFPIVVYLRQPRAIWCDWGRRCSYDDCIEAAEVKLGQLVQLSKDLYVVPSSQGSLDAVFENDKLLVGCTSFAIDEVDKLIEWYQENRPNV